MAKDEEAVELSDVHVKTKLPKKAKTGKDYWLYETNKGTVMCFEPSVAAKVNPSDTMGYTLSVVPPGEGFKNGILKAMIKMTEHVPAGGQSAPSAAPVGQAPYTPRPAGGGGSFGAMGRDMSTDIRISKLSVFSSISAIQAAKIKVDPDMAKASTAAILCETMDLTKAVLAELMYPELQPVNGLPSAAQAPAAAQPVSDEPPFKAPAQPAAQPAGQPAASTAMPPVTPKPAPAAPVQQVYTPPQPAQVATPHVAPAVPPVMMQSPADKAEQAKVLFGTKGNMEADMAARVARMLKKPTAV